jgi:hypothetical protein
LDQVCVAVNDPVTFVAPLEQAPDAFLITVDENSRSTTICIAPLKMP